MGVPLQRARSRPPGSQQSFQFPLHPAALDFYQGPPPASYFTLGLLSSVLSLGMAQLAYFRTINLKRRIKVLAGEIAGIYGQLHEGTPDPDSVGGLRSRLEKTKRDALVMYATGEVTNPDTSRSSS